MRGPKKNKPKPIQIFIKDAVRTGEVHSLDVHLDCTVENLKKMSEEIVRIPWTSQHLMFERYSLQDDHTLDYYNVRDLSTIYVAFRLIGGTHMRIHVKNLYGGDLNFQVESFDTVASLKQKIYDKDGISLDLQHIIYRGKELEDCNKLSHYNLVNDCTLHLVIRVCGG